MRGKIKHNIRARKEEKKSITAQSAIIDIDYLGVNDCEHLFHE